MDALCRKIGVEMQHAHPTYPHLNEMQLLSFVKRLLPEIRAMIAKLDDSSGGPAA